MCNEKKSRRMFGLCSVLLFCALVPAHAEPRLQQNPSISITEVPPYDCGGPDKQAPIAGKVSGIPSGQENDYRVVIYSQTCDDAFYVQPTVANPYTRLTRGEWNAHIHLGHTYWALLVNKSFKPKPKIDMDPI